MSPSPISPGRSSLPESVEVLPSTILLSHTKSAFCMAVFSSSPGWKLMFTVFTLRALRASWVSAPSVLRVTLKLPQLPSFTLLPSSRRRCTTLRSWRMAICASMGLRVVSSAIISATSLSSTSLVVYCTGYHFMGSFGFAGLRRCTGFRKILMVIVAFEMNNKSMIVRSQYANNPEASGGSALGNFRIILDL